MGYVYHALKFQKFEVLEFPEGSDYFACSRFWTKMFKSTQKRLVVIDGF